MGYSPTLGRFINRDPIGYMDGMNPYQAVHSSPVTLLDPLGLRTQQGPKTKDDLLQILMAEEAKFRDCWLYRGAGLDKLFAALTNAMNAAEDVQIEPNANAAAVFDRGVYLLTGKPVGGLTVVHETVHAFNWSKDHHQGSRGAANRADEGMAWAVEYMLQTAALLCGKTFDKCMTCEQAQKLWDSVFQSLRGIEGLAAGNNRYEDTVNRTHIWDVHAKLGLRLSASLLRAQFEAALKAKGLDCSITNAPANPPDGDNQPDPFE